MSETENWLPYDMTCPPLNIASTDYVPLSHRQETAISKEFFTLLQQHTQELQPKTLLSSGMEAREFGYYHNRQANQQRKPLGGKHKKRSSPLSNSM